LTISFFQSPFLPTWKKWSLSDPPPTAHTPHTPTQYPPLQHHTTTTLPCRPPPYFFFSLLSEIQTCPYFLSGLTSPFLMNPPTHPAFPYFASVILTGFPQFPAERSLHTCSFVSTDCFFSFSILRLPLWLSPLSPPEQFEPSFKFLSFS